MLSGDTLILGTGQRKEIVRVTVVEVSEKRTKISLLRPLEFDHGSGIDVSDCGTGISFSPATKFAHTSGDAVNALGSGISLDQSLQYAHGYGAPVIASDVPSAGYQGQSTPNRWFGMPLSPTVGSIALMDASGTSVVDAVVYGAQQSNSSANGTITSPELAVLEGDQGGGGCIVVVPPLLSAPGTSVGRYPDGVDIDSNCTDFRTQAAASILIDSSVGTTNIKVSSISNFSVGQTILVGSDSFQESATISLVGTAGGTLMIADTPPGATVVAVSSTEGFLSGQTITVGRGKEAETAIILSSTRRVPKTLVLSAPLTHAHATGSEVSGTGITLSTELKAPHGTGEILASGTPSPGERNR